jgi:hypothetical protein
MQVFVKEQKRRYHVRGLGICGRIVSKQILRKQGVLMWTGVIWLRTGSTGGLF